MERKEQIGTEPSAFFDRVSLWERVDNDMDLLRDLVRIFGQEYPVIVQKLDAAMEARNGAEIAKLGHKVRGAALQFSAHRVAATAARLEALGTAGSLDGMNEACEELKAGIAELLDGLRLMTNGAR
ncbi:MAG TPA: Hpt domain-containing protein [Candidatus Saccharimonadales bacterium]|jgi:HPt (histidine-containing phosphotransfer) domain-containing protein|nr:Hpt domain-containing protein [Candidatus Saccharimonadales bacterium]